MHRQRDEMKGYQYDELSCGIRLILIYGIFDYKTSSSIQIRCGRGENMRHY